MTAGAPMIKRNKKKPGPFDMVASSNDERGNHSTLELFRNRPAAPTTSARTNVMTEANKSAPQQRTAS
jgi:hypothetical protein